MHPWQAQIVSKLILPIVIAGLGLSTARAESSKVEATYTLSDIPLSSFLQAQLGISVADHGIKLGELAVTYGTVPATVQVCTG